MSKMPTKILGGNLGLRQDGNRFEKLNLIVKDIQQYENGLPKLVVKHFSLEKFRIRFART